MIYIITTCCGEHIVGLVSGVTEEQISRVTQEVKDAADAMDFDYLLLAKRFGAEEWLDPGEIIFHVLTTREGGTNVQYKEIFL